MGTPVGRKRMDLDDVAYVQAFEKCGGVLEYAAKELGVTRNAVSSRLRRMERNGIYQFQERQGVLLKQAKLRKEVEPAQLPPDDIETSELIDQRKRTFQRRQRYEEASKLIRVRVRVGGPVGILHFGDPHLDDDGTDIGAIERHCEIVNRTPGMFATCVGDMTNNWVGRLARLYAEQSSTAKHAWQLAEWFVKSLTGKWLYLVGGNHDLWSGAGDPLKWIARQEGAIYKASECRVALQLPNGQAPRINARHDFAGHSFWNPAHGPLKSLHLGVRDHMAVCGDKHFSAYGVLKCPETGITMHAIRVATYKIYDRYAMERGFRDQNLSPCAVTVINTELHETHADFIKLFWTPEEGADYLTHLRNRHARLHPPAGSSGLGRRS